MANKKEINQSSGKRLQELISDLQMTQEEFGSKIGLGARMISCIVTGTRRLTEENARRIAHLFGVRYEWLMGYDDYKTDTEYRSARLNQEIEGMWRNEYIETEEFVRTIVAAVGYKFSSVLWEEDDAIEELTPEFEKDFLKLRKLFNKENEILQEIFGKKELSDIIARLNGYNVEFAELWESSDTPYFSEQVLKQGDKTIDLIIENNRECAENWKKILAEREQSEYYYADLCDSSGNVLVEFTPRESNIFAHELYDVIHALISYHINKNKKTRKGKED